MKTIMKSWKQFVNENEGSNQIFLNGKEIENLKPIAGGASSWILSGQDGKIYAMSSVGYGDTSKPWLSAYYLQASPKPKHLPAIEYLGVAEMGGDEYYLTRMPFYRSTPSAKCEGIEETINKFRLDPFGEDRYFDSIPESCRDEIMELLSEMDSFEDFMLDKGDDGIYRDWNMANIGWDGEDNLVFFDGYTTEIPFGEDKNDL